MTFRLVQELAAQGVPVRLTCEVLGFSPQCFYKWRARPCSDRDRHDAQLTNAVVDLHADDPEFGYRFIADELEATGHRVGERRVWRLCSQQRIWSTTTKKGRKNAKTPGPAGQGDLLQQTRASELRFVPPRHMAVTAGNPRRRSEHSFSIVDRPDPHTAWGSSSFSRSHIPQRPSTLRRPSTTGSGGHGLGTEFRGRGVTGRNRSGSSLRESAGQRRFCGLVNTT